MGSDLSQKWVRIGVMLSTPASPGPVDIESLVVDSLFRVREDARLFWCIASWLAVHHEMVNTRRLGRMLGSLDTLHSALAGALLEIALLQTSDVPALVRLQGHCESLAEPRILFRSVEGLEGAEEAFRDQWIPSLRKWGFLNHQWTDKREAIRPIGWLIRNVPELRIRALLGSGQDAEILERALEDTVTVTQVSRELDYTYASSHNAAGRLIRRGLIQRVAEGREVYLQPDTAIREWLESFPG